MSSPQPQDPSPSKSTQQFDTRQSSANPSSPKQQPSPSYSSAETPQATAGPSSLPSTTSAAETRYPFGPPAPLILVSEPSLSPTSDRRDRDRAASVPRQGRSLEPQRSISHSSSQPTTRSSTPRTRSAPEQSIFVAMSSAASSPGTTSTSGSTSGSNPGYHLPYAPFPYPMPGGARGGQGGQGSGSGSGSGK